MLWVDLIQDTFGALALASEPPSESLLREPPVDRNESLINPSMWRNVVAQSIYQLSLLLFLWFKGKTILGLPGTSGAPTASSMEYGYAPGDAILVTVVFNTFVFCQVSRIVLWLSILKKSLNSIIFLG